MRRTINSLYKAFILFRTSQKQHTTINVVPSLLSAIEGSIGSRQFQHLYTLPRGDDVLKNGNLSCAWYVSTVLAQFRLIGCTHATVRSTQQDLLRTGWVEQSPVYPVQRGSVLIWEAIVAPDDTEAHEHIGFYIGNGLAVSNDYRIGVPAEHHFTFNDTRSIKRVLWTSDLD